MAGTGKRADSKKPSIWTDLDYFGKHGFVKPGAREKIRVINMHDLQERAERLLKEKKIEKKGETLIINLESLGYNKLLSKGDVTKKFDITAPRASENAVEKIKKAGGSVQLTVKKKVKVKAEGGAKPKPAKKKEEVEEVAEE